MGETPPGAEVPLTHDEADFTFGVVIATGHHGSHGVIHHGHHLQRYVLEAGDGLGGTRWVPGVTSGLAPGGSGEGSPALPHLFALRSVSQQLDHVLPHAARGTEAFGPGQQHGLEERQEQGPGCITPGDPSHPAGPAPPPHLIQAQLLAGEGEGEAEGQDLLHQVLLCLEVHDALDDVVKELWRGAAVKLERRRGGCPQARAARQPRGSRGRGDSQPSADAVLPAQNLTASPVPCMTDVGTT